MLRRSFFPNFGQGPFPKIAGKSPGFVHLKVHFYQEKDTNFHVLSGRVFIDWTKCFGNVCDVRRHIPAAPTAMVGKPDQCWLRSSIYHCHE